MFLVSIAAVFYALAKFSDGGLDLFLDKLINRVVISEISIKGNIQVAKEEIMTTLALSLPLEISDINTLHIKEELLKNPLIKDIEIKINLPSTLSLLIIERQPLALWFDQKQFHLIDEEGFIVKSSIEFQEDKNGYIIAAGADSNNQLRKLLDELKGHSISRKLFAAQLISNRRWNILLKNGLIVKLPENNVKEALVALDLILENYNPDKPFNIIDLRLAPGKVYAIF
ncbi:MAG: cell division protein FtsQ/DivIB [Candidatus Midichloria sp.]|nr:MAG: cell division protein FtsQ/DivIB [Candidatus Midichloria sp.]